MKISFIGLGKLGLPVAMSIAYKGHQVIGYDINPNRFTTTLDTVEAGLDGNPIKSSYQELFENNPDTKKNIIFTDDLEKAVSSADIIFVAVQTPHNPKYEGTTRLPSDRVDFDYTYLIDCIKNISLILDKLKVKKTVIVISTVLPTTIRNYIIPVMSEYINFCYNPYFIAMGTVIRDFLNPEFILLGCVSEEATEHLIDFYKTITNSPVYRTSLENAEMIKVSYNTFIGTKICLANNIMELCDKLPNTDCDEVMNGLFMATDRLISKNYLTGGMGDGGGCHPRDNIALSWLSKKLDVSYDFFDSIMTCRENQTEYIANLIVKYYNKYKDYDIYLFGKAFKSNTGISTGSPAILLSNILKEKGIKFVHYDPYVDDKKPPLKNKAIYCLSTKHSCFQDYVFPNGSVVIDPFRYIKKGKNGEIEIHSVGSNKNDL